MRTPVIDHIGDNIKKYRLQLGLDQKQLGQRVGVTSSAISAYEKHIRMPSIPVLIKFSYTFKIPIDALCHANHEESLSMRGYNDEDVKRIRMFIESIDEEKNLKEEMMNSHKQ